MQSPQSAMYLPHPILPHDGAMTAEVMALVPKVASRRSPRLYRWLVLESHVWQHPPMGRTDSIDRRHTYGFSVSPSALHASHALRRKT